MFRKLRLSSIFAFTPIFTSIYDIDFQSLITKLVDMIHATEENHAMGRGLLYTLPNHYLWEST